MQYLGYAIALLGLLAAFNHAIIPYLIKRKEEKERRSKIKFLKHLFSKGSRSIRLNIPFPPYNVGLTIWYNFFRKGKKRLSFYFHTSKRIYNNDYIGGFAVRHLWSFPKCSLMGKTFGFKLPTSIDISAGYVEMSNSEPADERSVANQAK